MDIPRATYRLQFHPGFTFDHARRITGYLSALGVSDIYASPIFQARPGSLHGYDIVDHHRINEELGGEAALRALIEQARRDGLGWLQDIVPNHMAYDGGNRMLMDLFENGRASSYAEFFDIDWEHPDEGLHGRLLAPFLDRLYRDALIDGAIQLRYGEPGFSVQYAAFRFPLSIESYATILTPGLPAIGRQLGPEHPDHIKLTGVVHALKHLSPADAPQERAEQAGFIKRMLWELYDSGGDPRRFIDELVEALNGRPGRPETFRALDELLSEQWFRLSFWKVATEEVNYRRFFGINDLIVLRTEEPAVYEETHRFLLRMVRDGLITGLRVDHIDGLYDPTGYLARLRADAGDRYIVVEKILQPEEPLPPFWPVQGTTGYDYLDGVNRLLCDQRQRGLRALYARFTGMRRSFDELAADAKGVIIERYLLSDADNLARLLKRISARDRRGRDLTLYGLKRAITELMECFPVYRTYISPVHHREEDRSAVHAAAELARGRNPELRYELNFLERFLSLEFNDDLTEEERREWINFVMRFQQYTGPLMAKGVEDTALYLYNRLLSMNEVGGAPWAPSLSPAQWHAFIQRRSAAWPHAMNATATHDTKRGEDARARLNVLSELPGEWKNHLAAWSRANRKLKSFVRGRLAPDRNDEYLLYQTLLGTAPLDADLDDAYAARIQEYMRKVIREAKRHGGWLAPDDDYERAAAQFVSRVLGSSEFARSFIPFLRRVGHYGIFNSLSQTLLKITSPGLPDFYQGAELWDLSLVDPDNRRPVDFDRRAAMLEAIRRRERAQLPALLPELLASKADGRIKLFLIYRALQFRTRHGQLFETGHYQPIEARGRWSRHVVAFARRREGAWAITVVPRLTTVLTGEKDAPCGCAVWGDTRLALPDDAPRDWREVIAGGRLSGGAEPLVGEMLARFPVALLSNMEPA